MIETKEFNDSDNEAFSFSDSEVSQESCVKKSPLKRKKNSEKKYTYTCMYDDCNKSYSRQHHLKRHEATHENSSLRCTEKDCERIFKTKFTLKKHVDNFHLKKKPKKYKCPDCDQEFNKHSWLTRHQYKHTGISPFVCTVEGCGKRFEFPSRLKRHLKVHQGYTCSKENCDQKFPTWTLYDRHVKTDHPTIHKCQICEKVFARSTNLKDHLEIHQLDRKVYLCPEANCSKFYFKNRNLMYHLKSYHEKRPFQCTLRNCFKAFKSQEDLNEHISHHDSKRRTRRKKKGKAKPTFAEKLAGLVPKKVSSSSNAVEHKAEDVLSEDKSKSTSSPEILINACQNRAEGNSECVSPVESEGKNEDVPHFISSDISDLVSMIETNQNIEKTMLNSQVICPQNSVKCISA